MQISLSPIVRLPRVFLEHPLPLEGQGVSPSIDFTGEEGAPVSMTLGGVDRWNRTGQKSPCPGFTLTTLSVLSALLALSERVSGTPISYNQLFRALGSRSCCSAHHREALKSALACLASIDLSLRRGDKVTFEKIIALEPCETRPVFGKPAPAFKVSFSPAFLQCLADSRACAPLHLQALCSIRSRHARALYLVLSTWAHYSKAHRLHPFRIGFSKLLAHLGQPVPRYLSLRRAFFFGHRSQSLFDEIKGLPTPYGILQIKIAPAATADDDCLLVWHSSSPDEAAIPAASSVSPRPPAAVSSPQKSAGGISVRQLKIYQAWKASGRSEVEFLQKVRNTRVALTQEDLQALQSARISPSSCESFLLMSKKLLPERTWQDLLGEAKYAAHQPAPPKSPTGKLIAEMLSALRGGI